MAAKAKSKTGAKKPETSEGPRAFLRLSEEGRGVVELPVRESVEEIEEMLKQANGPDEDGFLSIGLGFIAVTLIRFETQQGQPPVIKQIPVNYRSDLIVGYGETTPEMVEEAMRPPPPTPRPVAPMPPVPGLR